jgi:hypothetical protein
VLVSEQAIRAQEIFRIEADLITSMEQERIKLKSSLKPPIPQQTE